MASLAITSIAESAAAVDLTALAFDDWAHWGDSGNSITPSNRKNGGGSVIGAVLIITGAVNAFGDSPRGITWTDGTPTGSSTGNTNGVWLNGTGAVGTGCRLTFPADTTTRQAAIYCGSYAERLSIAASLSDSSATAVSDTTTLDDDGQTGMAGFVIIEYSAASGGQTLTVDVTCAEAYNGFGNTTISGAGVKAIGSSGVTCDLDVTDASDTLASIAALAIGAALAATDAADTLSASAVVGPAPITCTLDVSDAADVLAATAILVPLDPVICTLAVVDASDTLASQARIRTPGVFDWSVPVLTVATGLGGPRVTTSAPTGRIIDYTR